MRYVICFILVLSTIVITIFVNKELQPKNQNIVQAHKLQLEKILDESDVQAYTPPPKGK